MTTIVGIFDNAHDLDKAVGGWPARDLRIPFTMRQSWRERHSMLVRRSLRRALLRWWFGAGPEPALPHKPGHHAIARAFKAHLAHYHLPDR